MIIGDGMKKGFTLVELLAIIILLSLLFLLVYPKVLDIVEKENKGIDIMKQTLIHNAVLEYMEANLNNYPQNVGTSYCIELNQLDNEGLIPVDISEIKEKYKYIRVRVGKNNNHSFTLVDTDTEEKCLGY